MNVNRQKLTTFFLLRLNPVFRKIFLSNLGSRGHVAFTAGFDYTSLKTLRNLYIKKDSPDFPQNLMFIGPCIIVIVEE